MNKILKDMIVRGASSRAGRALPSPGWDCHGLPIENADRKAARPQPAARRMQAFRAAFATEQIAQQMVDFKRLGVLGEWDNGQTMNFASEAGSCVLFKR